MTAKNRPIENICDDCSLWGGASSEVENRFRASSQASWPTGAFRIYDQPGAQLILEETVDSSEDGNGERHGIKIKQTVATTYGLSFLKATYSLVAVFVGGFLFILGFDILLFLFIDLAKHLGLTHNSAAADIGPFVLTLLSVPLWVYSLSMGMTFVTRFIIDTFNGHPFLRTFGIDVVVTDWMAFLMYLGIPVVTIIITLFQKRDDWWEISLITWFSTVLIFWSFFSACVFVFEIRECFELICEVDDTIGKNDSVWKKSFRTIIYSMGIRLSGKRSTYHKLKYGGNGSSENSDVESERINNICPVWPYSLVTQLECCSRCFKTEGLPKPLYTINQARGNMSFVTKSTWSLQRLFCRCGGILSGIPVTFGESGITEQQMNSTIACKLLGSLLIVLLLAGAVVWLGVEGASLAIFLLILCVLFITIAASTLPLLHVRDDIVKGNETLRFWKMNSITRPTDMFVVVFIGIQVLGLYIIPLAYLGAVNNDQTAGLYASLGFFSLVRHYMNPSILLQERGPGYFIVDSDDPQKNWNKKSRFYHIVQLGSDDARRFWSFLYGFFILVFVMIVLLAANDFTTGAVEDQNYGFTDNPLTLLSGFEYPGQPHLPYPTCRMKKGVNVGDLQDASLSDFAFLSALAYATEDGVQVYLDEWFGTNVAMNNPNVVNTFKQTYADQNTDFDHTVVAYRLITFPNDPDAALLTIKGTSTIFDVMADAQLWLSATLFQGLRGLLPMGGIFTPILRELTCRVFIGE